MYFQQGIKVIVNEVEYPIHKKLVNLWNSLRGEKLIKNDEDRVYIVDGRERSGKSVFAIQQAAYLDPKFSVDQICFTPEDFVEKIRTCEKGRVIVFDEAFRGLSSAASRSKVNQKIKQAMMEMGQKNLIIFIVLPSFFLLDIYAAMLRSNSLFHVYRNKKGKRGFFKAYNYKKKAQLYQTGLKKGWSYAKPDTRFKGLFTGKYPIDEIAYRKKKHLSLVEMEKAPEAAEEKPEKAIVKEMRAQRDWWMNKCRELTGKSVEEMVNLSKEAPLPLKRASITNITRQTRVKLPN
jgi:hypothetical protein